MKDFNEIQQLLDKLTVTTETLSADSRIQIFYHADLDGAIAAAYFIDRLQRAGKFNIAHRCIHTEEFDFSIVLDWLSSADASGVELFTFDINFSGRSDVYEAMERSEVSHVTIVDDHTITATIRKPDKVDFLNPSFVFDKSIDFPPSLFCYVWARISRSVINWPGALGANFDKQLVHRREYFDQKVPDDRELVRAEYILSAPYAFDPFPNWADPVLSTILNAIQSNLAWDNFSRATLNDSSYFGKSNLFVEKIIMDEAVHGVRDSGATIDKGNYKIKFYEQKSPYRVTSPVSSAASELMSESVIVVAHAKPNKVDFELRVTDDLSGINLVDLLRGVNKRVAMNSFGGHPRAAGGSVLLKDRTKDQVISEYMTALRESEVI